MGNTCGKKRNTTKSFFIDDAKGENNLQPGLDLDPWLFETAPTKKKNSSPTTPSPRGRGKSLWGKEKKTPSKKSSITKSNVVERKCYHPDYVAGDIHRLSDDGRASRRMWATLEKGRLLYFEQQGKARQALGYVALMGAQVKSSPDSNISSQGSIASIDSINAESFERRLIGSVSLFVLTLKEESITVPMRFGFESFHEARRWLWEIILAIRGKVHPPRTAMRNGGGKDSTLCGHHSALPNVLQDDKFPTKSGALLKKAIGKKKVGYKNWKIRHFRLQCGEIRYYKNESFKTSTLKGTIELKTCPGMAIVTGSPKKTLTVPLPKNVTLTCKCSSEAEALVWMNLINRSITIAKGDQRKRCSSLSPIKKSKKRHVIVSDTTGACSDAKLPTPEKIWTKGSKTTAIIKKALKNHFLFEKAPDFDALLDALQPLDATAGDCIIWEGDNHGEKFFVLEEGKCCVVKDDCILSFQQVAGSAFGELALIHNAPRAATVRCLTPCKLWYVERMNFRRILSNLEASLRDTQVKFLRQISLFGDLSEATLFNIAESMNLVKFDDGQLIIKQDEVGEEFFLIRRGTVLVTQKMKNSDEDKVLARCGPGDYFGELALLKNEPRQANVVASGEVELFALNRVNFNKFLGPLQKILDVAKDVALMKKVEILADNLNESEMEQVSRALERKVCKDGHQIIKQGDHGDHFYMIESGSVTISIDGVEVGSLSDSSATPYFGEMSLIRDDVRVASVTADGSAHLVYLDRHDFNRLLGPLKDIILKVARQRNEENSGFVNRVRKALSSASRASIALSSSRRSSEFAIPFEALVEKRILGVGTFGTVKLVQDGRSGRPYALKVLRKEKIMQMKQLAHVYTEREALQTFTHPLILRFYASYQDANALYMLLELVPGGELFSLLRSEPRILPQSTMGGLALDFVKFYASNVLTALEHMHSRGVAYRDLKPENLIIDAEGYIRVIDLGFAKKIVDGEKRNTICGTPEYIAPELVLSRGHCKAVDIWAFGILLFELLTNKTPFEASEPTEMFAKIANPKEFLKNAFPKKFHKKSRVLIESLLEEIPVKRLGCRKDGIQELWDNGWFDGFTADLIERKALVAPFVPKMKGPLDVANFDDFKDEVEDLHHYSYSGPPDGFKKWGGNIR